MTRLLNPPRPIEVEVGDDGAPRQVRGPGSFTGPVRPVQRWVVEMDWWSEPIARDCWRVLLRGRLLCEIYRDRADGAWYLERVYD